MHRIEPDGSGTVLICEDEAIVAMDLRFLVEDMGLGVIGPFAARRDALRVIGSEGAVPTAAILDVSLRDGDVFPLADALHAAGVALIFHSAHLEGWEIDARFPGALCCPKPSASAVLGAALAEALEQRQVGARLA